ncbi:MAG: segregation and condensation protein A [Desulfomonilia bacterium]
MIPEERSVKQEFVLRLPAFEGPLDVLLYLIEKNRFTLETLEVCPIVDQYLAYIEQMRTLDITLAGEFLEMASYLIYLKSCLLVPTSEFGEYEGGVNPVQELKEMLSAYRAIKQASTDLAHRPMLYRDRFPKGTAQVEQSLSVLSMGNLLQALHELKARTRKYVMDVLPTRFSIQEIMVRIQGLVVKHDKIRLEDAVQTGERMELIGAFMAALEMSRAALVRIIQRRVFSIIYLMRK